MYYKLLNILPFHYSTMLGINTQCKIKELKTMYNIENINKMDKKQLLEFINTQLSLSERASHVNKDLKYFLDSYTKLMEKTKTGLRDHYFFNAYCSFFRILEFLPFFKESEDCGFFTDDRIRVLAEFGDYYLQFAERFNDSIIELEKHAERRVLMQSTAYMEELLTVY